MRKLGTMALALSLGAGLAGPGAAEDRSQRFVEMMGRLPQTLVESRSPVMPEFLDFEVAARVVAAAAAARPGDLRDDDRRLIGGPFSDLPEASDWSGTVGFTAKDLRAAAFVQEPPDTRLALLLATEAAARVPAALAANGYTASEDRGFPAFWRGGADFAMDLGARNPDDPFGFPLPKSSRIVLDGDILLHSASWPGLESMVTATGAGPTVLALGQALDLPDWGDRGVVQAILFTDPAAFAPGFRLGEGLTPEATPPGAVPAWNALMLADLSDGISDLTLVVMAYATQTDAQAAAQALEANWATTALPSFGDMTLAETVGTGATVVTGDGPFLAIYAVETEPEIRSPGMLLNRGYHVLLTAAVMRELTILAPIQP